MSWRDWWLRLRALVRPGRVERDLQDELAFHLDREVEALVAAGRGRDAARREAAARFGSVTLAADQCRDERRLSAVTDLIADVRYSLRQFRGRPVVTATMVVVLALGLGISAAVFVMVSALTSTPPAGVRADASMVRIRGVDPRTGPGRAIGREFTFAEYREYSAQSEIFAAVGAWTSSDAVLDVGLAASNLHSGAVTYVTDDYFSVLGLTPARGVVRHTGVGTAGVISDAIWERFYGRSPDVIGQAMKVNGVPVTIAGVAPRRFAGARTGGSVIRVWLPLAARPTVQHDATMTAEPEHAVLGLIARLRPGVEPERATTVVRTIASRHSLSGRGFSSDVVPLNAENYFPPSGEKPSMAGRIVAFLIPLLVLLITCTSVSALLAGLALARRREMVVRLALGAGRRRIIRQLLTETSLLAVAGGLVGVFVLWIVLEVADATFLNAPLIVGWRAAIFTTALALVTGVVFGLSPALHATRRAVSDVLKEADVAGGQTRLQAMLVVAQIALTQPALLGMGTALLELREDWNARPTTAFAENVLDVRFNTNPRYGAMDARREAALLRLQERLAAMPGVVGVVRQDAWRSTVRVSAHPGSDQEAAVVSAPPGYFDVMGMRVTRGRAFTHADDTTPGLVVVGSRLSQRLWGDAEPVGRQVIASDGDPEHNGPFTVIGVVEDPLEDRVFLPGVRLTGHFLIRAIGPAEDVLPDVRAAAQQKAPTLPIISARSLAAIEAEERWATIQRLLTVGGATLLALGLAAIGLYAVVSVSVGQRTREIGIRTALGANRQRIVRLFLTRGVRLAALGLAAGLAFSVAVARIMAAVQGEAPPGLFLVSAGVTLFVMAVALIASWVPARRAATVDPVRAIANP